MGRDKATLDLAGSSLLARAVAALRPVADPVILAGGSRHHELPGCVSAADPLPDRGPLGGLVAALRASPHRLCAVVAVDMPELSGALLRTLAGLWAGEAAVVPIGAGRPQPLHAVYSRDALAAAEAALAGDDLSLMGLLGRLPVRFVGPEELGVEGQAADWSTSLDTPQDAERWLRTAGLVPAVGG